MSTSATESAHYAGFWRRALAYSIDLVILTIAFTVAALLLRSSGLSEQALSAAFSLGAIIPAWMYFALMESGLHQGTIGKRALGIRVTDLGGTRVTFGRASARHFAKISTALTLGIGALMAGWTKRRQALHDMLADTLVVAGEQQHAAGQSSIAPLRGSKVALIVATGLLPIAIGVLLAVAIPQFQGAVEQTRILHREGRDRSSQTVEDVQIQSNQPTDPGPPWTERELEPMKNAVLPALKAQSLDRLPPKRSFASDEERLALEDWIEAMSRRLETRLIDRQARVEFLRTLDYEATRAGLNRQLVLAVIDRASGFQQDAVSEVGACGYLQIRADWTTLIGDGDARKLFDTQVNLRYGTVLLRRAIDQNSGNVASALDDYRRQVMGIAHEQAGSFEADVLRLLNGTWQYSPSDAPGRPRQRRR